MDGTLSVSSLYCAHSRNSRINALYIRRNVVSTITLYPPTTITPTLPITPLPDVPIRELVISLPPIHPVLDECYRCFGAASTTCDNCGKLVCRGCYSNDIGPCQIERHLCNPCQAEIDQRREEGYARYAYQVQMMARRVPYPFLARAEP